MHVYKLVKDVNLTKDIKYPFLVFKWKENLEIL